MPNKRTTKPLDPNEELTVQEVAAMTGLAITTIRDQIRKGKIASRMTERDTYTQRGGGLHKITRAELHRYLESRKESRHEPYAVNRTYRPPDGATLDQIPIAGENPEEEAVKRRRAPHVKAYGDIDDPLTAIRLRAGMGGPTKK